MKYQYSIANDTATGAFNNESLKQEIKASSLPQTLIYIKSIASLDLLEIEFSPDLTTSEKTTLDGIISAHTGDPLLGIKNIVDNAVNFFYDTMVQFAAENVSMGITQAGKTKEVADYLATVMRYGQSGSLYEVINEVNVLIAEPPPAGLSPFVTVQRLEDLKAKVEAYLGI